jgi:hypothetical protein
VTLIQTWVGGTAILQVSDRRLTDPTTGDVKNDIYNKAVSWCGRRAVSFTGLAYIDRRQKEPVSHFFGAARRSQTRRSFTTPGRCAMPSPVVSHTAQRDTHRTSARRAVRLGITNCQARRHDPPGPVR